MPVGVRRINGKYRIVEPGGDIATTPNGKPRDGGGHPTEAQARRQQRAINANIKKAKLRTLYVHRPVLNGDEFAAWARSQGFTQTLAPDDFHVTIAFSRNEVDWAALPAARDRWRNVLQRGRAVKPLGDKGAVVLAFRSYRLAERHAEFNAIGCSWEWPSYQPHITITYDGAGTDLAAVMPFRGALHFGSEVYSEVVEDWEKQIKEQAA
jgi:hypothetical protein